MSNIDLAGVASTASTVDEAIIKILPWFAEFGGFIPGAAVAVPFEPLALEILTKLDGAFKAVAAGNPGAAFKDILTEVGNHLTPGAPNSPSLS